MKFKTLAEAMRFAIAKEESSHLFYRDLAGAVADPNTKTMFEVLANAEIKHKETLELEMMKQGISIAVSPPVEEEGSILEMDESAIKMNYLDALQLAMQKEKAAFHLYADMMSKASTPEMKAIFFELAEEEMRHLLQFENEYSQLQPKKK